MNKDVAKWYADKIEVTLKYHKKKYNQEITDKSENKGREYISWQFIARAIEKNDFWMKKLYFSESKAGYSLLEKLKGQNVPL
jgi:predicted phosphoadenosine phosphosulfate sulfurtransferase